MNMSSSKSPRYSTYAITLLITPKAIGDRRGFEANLKHRIGNKSLGRTRISWLSQSVEEAVEVLREMLWMDGPQVNRIRIDDGTFWPPDDFARRRKDGAMPDAQWCAREHKIQKAKEQRSLAAQARKQAKAKHEAEKGTA